MLTYGCEIWGYENTELIEKVQNDPLRKITGSETRTALYVIWRVRTYAASNHYKDPNYWLLEQTATMETIKIVLLAVSIFVQLQH